MNELERCAAQLREHERCHLQAGHADVHRFGGMSWATDFAVLQRNRSDAGYCCNPTNPDVYCTLPAAHEGEHRWKPRACDDCKGGRVGWCTCHVAGVTPVISRKRKARALDVFRVLLPGERLAVMALFCERCGVGVAPLEACGCEEELAP